MASNEKGTSQGKTYSFTIMRSYPESSKYEIIKRKQGLLESFLYMVGLKR